MFSFFVHKYMYRYILKAIKMNIDTNVNDLSFDRDYR